MSDVIDALGDTYKRTNDVSDFENLIREYRPEMISIVKHTLIKYGCALHYADDIESEIEYKLFESIPTKYESTQSGFSHWSYILITNYTKDVIRRRKKTVSICDPPASENKNVIFDSAIFKKTVASLTPIQQQSINLVYINGKTFEDAGKEMGVSTGTVWNLCKNAISIIKKSLSDDESIK